MQGSNPSDLWSINRDSRDGRSKLMTLPGAEFLRRFLQHMPPRGLHRVRAFGLLHPSQRVMLQRVQLLLRHQPTEQRHDAEVEERCSRWGSTLWIRGPRLSPTECVAVLVEPASHLARNDREVELGQERSDLGAKALSEECVGLGALKDELVVDESGHHATNVERAVVADEEEFGGLECAALCDESEDKPLSAENVHRLGRFCKPRDHVARHANEMKRRPVLDHGAFDVRSQARARQCVCHFLPSQIHRSASG